MGVGDKQIPCGDSLIKGTGLYAYQFAIVRPVAVFILEHREADDLANGRRAGKAGRQKLAGRQAFNRTLAFQTADQRSPKKAAGSPATTIIPAAAIIPIAIPVSVTPSSAPTAIAIGPGLRGVRTRRAERARNDTQRFQEVTARNADWFGKEMV